MPPAKKKAPAKKRSSDTKAGVTAQASGEATRNRIVHAALETIIEDGIVGTSARAIARRGGFNQALIFYHFGSIEDLLVAALDALSGERMLRYETQLAEVTTLADLVAVAHELHSEDQESGHFAVLAQLIAGGAANPDLGARLQSAFTPWFELIQRAIERVLGEGPFSGLVPSADLAYAVSSMFLGLELLERLEPGNERSKSLLDAFDRVAPTLGMLLGGGGFNLPAPDAPNPTS